MSSEQVTLEAWRRLYAAATKVMNLEPWETMTETDIFGVQDPETGSLVFVSVMGMMGEHYGVSVYLGEASLYDFLDLEDTGDELPHSEAAERVLSMRQLQASFEDRDLLEKEDRARIKELGLKFRGRNSWPMFRSYEAGLFPWFLNAGEVRLLTHALEQLAAVLPDFVVDESLLESNDEDGEHFLICVPRQEGETLTWSREFRHILPPLEAEIPVTMDTQLLNTFKMLPHRSMSVEIDFFMVLSPVQEKGRPFFPFMVLIVDGKSGMVIGSELLTVETSLEALWGSVPLAIIQRLAGAGIVPQKMRVMSGRLFQVLKSVTQEAGISLELAANMPALEEAKYHLSQFMMHGDMPFGDLDFDLPS